MTDAPEKIWAGEDQGSGWRYGHWDLAGQSDLNDRHQYTRSDLIPRWYRMDDPDNPPPKDGAYILSYIVEHSMCEEFEIVRWAEQYESWQNIAYEFVDPDFWMPLPQPPGSKE